MGNYLAAPHMPDLGVVHTNESQSEVDTFILVTRASMKKKKKKNFVNTNISERSSPRSVYK